MQPSAPVAVEYVPVKHAVHTEAPAAIQQSDPPQSHACQTHIVRAVALLGQTGPTHTSSHGTNAGVAMRARRCPVDLSGLTGMTHHTSGCGFGADQAL
jgi:hypothetical protein